MFVVKYRKIFFALSLSLIALSVYGFLSYGLKYSIDFKGGTITEVSYDSAKPSQEFIESKIKDMNLGGFSVRGTGDKGYIIRTRELTEAERTDLVSKTTVEGNSAPKVVRSNTIGPVAGEELKSKAIKAIMVVVIMIVLFVTFAFRRVSKPVSSWKFGFATVVALAHDVIIPTGIFAYLGHIYGMEVDLLFVTGLLAILGYSVHDTIVVFDRVRENLKINRDHGTKEEFEHTVGESVQQTFGRSINTSLTIFITLLALYLVGGESTHEFALLLMIGIVVGTYSSIFVASPLLVTFQKWSAKRDGQKKDK